MTDQHPHSAYAPASDPAAAPASAAPIPGTLPAFTPVPRKLDRSNGWKPEVQRAFIEALADTGSVCAACRRVGRAEVGVYLLRRHPEAASFRAAWEAALALGIQRIEDVAMDRALNGVEVPVYGYGKIIGTRRVYNDRLLMFMLRNRAPTRFAAGGARGLNAVDQTTLKRLKTQWREEWEIERAENDEQEVLHAIDGLFRRLGETAPDAQAAGETGGAPDAASKPDEDAPKLPPPEEEAAPPALAEQEKNRAPADTQDKDEANG